MKKWSSAATKCWPSSAANIIFSQRHKDTKNLLMNVYLRSFVPLCLCESLPLDGLFAVAQEEQQLAVAHPIGINHRIGLG